MKKKMLSRVLSSLKPYGFLLVLGLICAVFVVAAALLIPLFCGYAIDGFLGVGNVKTDVLQNALLLIVIFTVVGALAQHLFALLNHRVAFSVCRDLRNRVSQKIHKIPVSYLDSHQTGDIVSRVVNDVETFSDGLLMSFSQLFSGILTIAAIIGIILYLNFVIALVVILLTPLSIFAARFIATRTHRFFSEQAAIRGEETALVNEWLQGGRVVKAFGHEKASLQQFDTVNGRLHKASLRAVFYSSLTNPTTRILNNIVYAALALICALYALNGKISVGVISVFLSYASQYAKPFNDISSVITELQNAFVCAARVFAFLDAEEEADMQEDAPLLLSDVRGAVSLADVSFSYSPARPLIKHLSLAVKAGERVAIVGPTGCGKTTLINLLMRFYDVNEGAITVDGEDIRSMPRKQLRARYGMVLQDTWLKAGTVRENIAYGRPDATEEEIVAAAKAAHAHSFIRRLPEGYDTKITENGSNFSAGERQLLCIARAMLVLPPMLILDEATSSIDTRTEQKIQNAFAKMMQGRTTFIVAHRLSTIQEADVILVMKDGDVIQQGDHASLLAKNGFYATLYRSQFAQA